MPNRGTLRWLSVRHNRLKILDLGIGFFTDLQVLDLGDNQLESLPESIGNLVLLKDLTLSNNKLTELPQNFSHLIQLSDLYLGSNIFSEFPIVLKNLKILHVLSLKSNQIMQVPNWIKELSSLYKFSIQNNQISQLPEEILNLPLLELVFISPKHLDPFFIDLLEDSDREYYGKLLPPNQHTGMIKRWKNFISNILEKIKNDIPLDAWEQKYPLYSKYENILKPVIDQTQNSTAQHVKRLIERAKTVKVGLLKKIIL
jgi:hypothetical protein